MQNSITIGVLGLQGTIREHVQAVENCGGQAVVVRTADQLSHLDGVILPGGGSKTIELLLEQSGFIEPLKEFAKSGKPMFGTGAGLMILANLALIDVTVERSTFTQQENFEAELAVAGVAPSVTVVFIQPPHIIAVGENVEILAKYNGRIAMIRDDQFLGCSFQPELTDDDRLTHYFLEMVKATKKGLLEGNVANGTSV